MDSMGHFFKMHSYNTRIMYFICDLNQQTTRLHPHSSALMPEGVNSVLPIAWKSSPADQQQRDPQRCFVKCASGWQKQKKKKNLWKLFQSSNPWAATCATSPICACQVCVGSDKLALLHSSPTPQSTAIIFPYAISRSLPHLSLSASAHRVLVTKSMSRPASHTHKNCTWINLSF